MNTVNLEMRDGVAWINIDDGKVNVMSTLFLEAITKRLDEARDKQAVTVIAGRAGIFSAGSHSGTEPIPNCNRNRRAILSNGFNSHIVGPASRIRLSIEGHTDSTTRRRGSISHSRDYQSTLFTLWERSSFPHSGEYFTRGFGISVKRTLCHSGHLP